ncbi:hypothetical protein [Leptospira johnsonii]|uniref:Efflux ABC transporter, permease protein n=1 Tax=Leptospira johnsonii TaxID=1917820 RepID=A0A2P2D7R2_9LEPT|nr:hypothetical protein [Leptospira johnsonii]GBF40672.1 efflux ABC transporter, permease protein [Leptospira johnsonii]
MRKILVILLFIVGCEYNDPQYYNYSTGSGWKTLVGSSLGNGTAGLWRHIDKELCVAVYYTSRGIASIKLSPEECK